MPIKFYSQFKFKFQIIAILPSYPSLIFIHFPSINVPSSCNHSSRSWFYSSTPPVPPPSHSCSGWTQSRLVLSHTSTAAACPVPHHGPPTVSRSSQSPATWQWTWRSPPPPGTAPSTELSWPQSLSPTSHCAPPLDPQRTRKYSTRAS